MSTKQERTDETFARIIIESTLAVSLESAENGKNSRPDFVSFSDGMVLEVTTYTDQCSMALKKGLGDEYVISEIPYLNHDWIISTRDYPHMKQLRDRVFPVLNTLDTHLITEYHDSYHSWWMEKVPTLREAIHAFKSAQVESIFAWNPSEKSGGVSIVGVMYGLNWSYGGPDASLKELETWIPTKQDNLRKLDSVALPQKHLFIWLNEFTPRSVLDSFTAERFSLPSRLPELPSQVTHLWVVDIKTRNGWFFAPEKGWIPVNGAVSGI